MAVTPTLGMRKPDDLPGYEWPIPQEFGSAQAPRSAGPATTSKGRRWLFVAVIAIVAVVALTIFVVLKVSADTPIETAAKTCNVTMAVSDDGTTLSLHHVAAEENPGPFGVAELGCVTSALGIPQSVQDHMGSTRALDGMQTDSWNGISARWNYHPDDGINITFTEQ